MTNVCFDGKSEMLYIHTIGVRTVQAARNGARLVVLKRSTVSDCSD